MIIVDTATLNTVKGTISGGGINRSNINATA